MSTSDESSSSCSDENRFIFQWIKQCRYSNASNIDNKGTILILEAVDLPLGKSQMQFRKKATRSLITIEEGGEVTFLFGVKYSLQRY